MLLLSFADFLKKNIYIFKKNSVRTTIQVSSNLDPDQDRHNVSPDLDPNCLKRLLADYKSCR